MRTKKTVEATAQAEPVVSTDSALPDSVESSVAAAEETPAADEPTEPVADSEAWPRTFKVTNNTPIPVYLSEAGVNLPPNYMAPANTATVVFQSNDALTREKSNADATGKAHGFTDVLIVEAAD